MPIEMQPKLLRALEQGEITPVGDNRPRTVDVRVIAATNRDLSVEIPRRRFREDLFYRISAFPIRLSPLRERTEDIPLLVDRFMTRAGERHRKRIAGVDPDAVERMLAFAWPGNVRELQNEIERAVALARDGEVIGLRHLSRKLLRDAEADSDDQLDAATDGDETGFASPQTGARAVGSPGVAPGRAQHEISRPRTPDRRGGAAAESPARPLRDARAAFEARYIAETLAREHGNVSQAARALGLSRSMLHAKMKQYGLHS
jgi:DNA-binding NtrC family response regulator